MKRSLDSIRDARQAVVAALALLALLAFNAQTASAADQLIMFEQQGCPFCAAWNQDVAPVYPKTEEGKVLPLRRVDIHASRPQDLRAISGIVYTPTFVLLHCGREAGRITGYPGDEQFWGLLDAALKSIRSGGKSSACPPQS